MIAFAKTNIGKAREINQDYYYISTPEDPIQLYILADGMGGYNGGEIASVLATNSVKNYIKNNFDAVEHNKEEIQKLIINAIEYANMIVYEKSKEDSQLEGMGTTLEVCLIYNNIVYIGHIGDSRVYIIRNNTMQKITEDHSYVQKLIKDGTITKEEAQMHPRKNMLTNALGCTPFAESDIIIEQLQKDDIIVITSDGLTNMINDEEICTTIIYNVNTAADNLIERANNLGGYDNITVVIIKNV